MTQNDKDAGKLGLLRRQTAIVSQLTNERCCKEKCC